MIQDLQDLCLFDVVDRLRSLVMVNQNQLFFLDTHEVSTGNGTDVFSTGINHRECTVTGFRHNVFDLVGKIIAPEDHQIVFFHKILDRNTLVDQTGHGKGIVRCGNDHLISLLCQFLDRFSDFGSQTYDQTACIGFDGTQLILRTVSENNQIVFIDKAFHRIRLGQSHDHFSFDKVSMFITHDDLSIHSIRDTPVLCSCLGEQCIVIRIHIGFGDVSGRDQAFNLAFFVCDRQCYRIMLLHQFPCPLHRHAVCRSRCLMKIHVFHLGSHIRQITGCRHMEIFQYKFCFFVDLSGSLCHICSLSCSILDVGICDRRTDRIRVRILVSDDINFIIFSHK